MHSCEWRYWKRHVRGIRAFSSQFRCLELGILSILCTLLLALFCSVLCCSIIPSDGFPTHAVASIHFEAQLSEYERHDVERSLPAARITEVGDAVQSDAVVVVGSTAPTEDV
jgi:hypothetical protein